MASPTAPANPFGNVPTFTIPPPPPSTKKGATSVSTQLAKFVNAHPTLKPWLNLIAQWSSAFKANPLTVAAVMYFENPSGKNTPYNPNVQGAGVAQINPGNGPNEPAFENLYGKLDPMNPSQAIQFLAWNVGQSNNLDAQTFYTTVWNRGFKPTPLRPGPGPLLKGYPGIASGLTPPEAAASAAARASAKGQVPYNLAQLRYRYFDQIVAAALGKQYTLAQAQSLANEVLKQVAAQKLPPGQELIALQSRYTIAVAGFKATLSQGEIKARYETQMMQKAIAAGYTQADARKLVAQAISQTAKAQLPPDQIGQFLTGQYALDATTLAAQLKAQKQLQAAELSQLKRTTTEFSPTFLAYAGRLPTVAEIQNIIDSGTSKYQVATTLMGQAGFQKSPIWLQNVSRYQAYYQSVFGNNTKAPAAAISYAILHSLDETAFKNMLQHDQLPNQANYTTSEEYKGLYATYQAAYSNIYGLPDTLGKQMIDQAIKKGWTADQWTQYLRKQPEYTSSGEYQARAQDLAQRMGLILAPQQTLVSPTAQPTEAMTDELQNPAPITAPVVPPPPAQVPVGEPKNQPPFTRPVARS